MGTLAYKSFGFHNLLCPLEFSVSMIYSIYFSFIYITHTKKITQCSVAFSVLESHEVKFLEAANSIHFVRIFTGFFFFTFFDICFNYIPVVFGKLLPQCPIQVPPVIEATKCNVVQVILKQNCLCIGVA